MQMNGINGRIAVSKYWRVWRHPRLVVLVPNNRDVNLVEAGKGSLLMQVFGTLARER